MGVPELPCAQFICIPAVLGTDLPGMKTVASVTAALSVIWAVQPCQGAIIQVLQCVLNIPELCPHWILTCLRRSCCSLAPNLANVGFGWFICLFLLPKLVVFVFLWIIKQM